MAYVLPFANIPFGNNISPVSDNWSKGHFIDLMGHRRGSSSAMALVNFQIKMKESNDFQETLRELPELHQKTEDFIRDMEIHYDLKDTFFDYLVEEDRKDRYKLMNAFYDELLQIRMIEHYNDYKQLIDYIIGISDMIRKFESMVENFYSMSIDYIRIGINTAAGMLKSIIKDIKKNPSSHNREFINQLYTLSMNIDVNLQEFAKLAGRLSSEVLDIVCEIFDNE